MIMGMSQCGPESPRTRLFYLLSCFVVSFHDYVPWVSFVNDIVRG